MSSFKGKLSLHESIILPRYFLGCSNVPDRDKKLKINRNVRLGKVCISK